MKYFKSLRKEDICRLIQILDVKGCASENDFGDIYFVQYPEAVRDLNELLKNNGYLGVVTAIAYCDCVAVYGVYDEEKIEYEEAREYMRKEWQKQN